MYKYPFVAQTQQLNHTTQLADEVEVDGMPSAEDIPTRLAQRKPRLEREYPISELGIFGSYARGEQRSDSDLDVLVAFEEPVTLFDLVRLENELADELGVEVDLVTKDSLKPRIESRVTEDVVNV